MMIKKHIPNAITSLNLLSGSVAAMMAYQGNYQAVVLFMLLSAIFDFLDGFSARLLKAYSPIGKELDSLADMISFGLTPAMLAFSLLQNSEWEWAAWFGLLIAVFSALRLAKFNIDERQTTSFIGLATPANAIFWGGLAFSYGHLSGLPNYPWLILIFIAVSCFLLVCETPMFSLKFKNFSWLDNKMRYIFLMGALILLFALRLNALSIIIVWYVQLAFIDALFPRKKTIQTPKL